jgi:hypothetical protein
LDGIDEFCDGMKALNVKVAAILLTMGGVVLLAAVTQSQGGTICTLTAAACAQLAAQAAQAATVMFFEYFVSGMALISIAALLLVSGRSHGPTVSVGSS